MAHFAKLDENNIVVNVIIADQEWVDAQEDTYIETCPRTKGGVYFGDDKEEDTSGTPLRKNFAGKGMIYDSSRDAFYHSSPFPSWTLDEDTCLWIPPTPNPTDDTTKYSWDEDTTSWVVRDPQ